MKQLSFLLLALLLLLSACSEGGGAQKTHSQKLVTYSEAKASSSASGEERGGLRAASGQSSSEQEPSIPESSSSSEPEPESGSSSEPEPQSSESTSQESESSSAPVIETTDGKTPLPSEQAAVETDSQSTTNWQAAEPTGYAADFDEALTNLRAQYGLGPLEYYSELNTVAFTRLTEAATVFSHTRPDGRECRTVMDDFGLQYIGYGENLARGAENVYAAYQLWFDSEQHLANMVRPNYSGYCIVTGIVSGVQYWVVLFVI